MTSDTQKALDEMPSDKTHIRGWDEIAVWFQKYEETIRAALERVIKDDI